MSAKKMKISKKLRFTSYSQINYFLTTIDVKPNYNVHYELFVLNPELSIACNVTIFNVS